MTQQPTTPGGHPHDRDRTDTTDTLSGAGFWATGGTIFAGVVLLVDGLLNILKGISAVSSDRIYAQVDNYTYRFDLTGWGWALVIVGAIAVLTGLGLLVDALWARIVGVFMASISLVANFLWLPHLPLWGLISIALDAWVIWALTAHRPQRPATL